MPQSITKGYKALLAEAGATVETIDVETAAALQGGDDVVFVDLRDPRELDREGRLPGAFHCPRGMLVFFCASGWRSALAASTAQAMGLKPVAHLAGGFSAWKTAGKPVELKNAER
jgi:rhodanese-related sulfurtransferase